MDAPAPGHRSRASQAPAGLASVAGQPSCRQVRAERRADADVADNARLTATASRGGAGQGVKRWCAGIAVRASLIVTPRLAALLMRRAFAAGGSLSEQKFEKHAPPGVVALTDERYGDEDNMLLDVFRPGRCGGAASARPLGTRGRLGRRLQGRAHQLPQAHREPWLRGRRAGYSLAPEHQYPTPPRQMMQALEYLQVNADRYRYDPDRIAIGGDSAGARIAAQLGALVTTPDTPRPSASPRSSRPRSYAASSSRAAGTTSGWPSRCARGPTAAS